MCPQSPHTVTTGAGTTRAVIYARYSSDHQRAASIEDQVRLCRAKAEREGWRVTEVYADRAISGASLLRPGYQAMMEHARKGEVDVVLAESLDRLSRDQEETAALFKRLQFFGVELITVSEGPITELHVGLKGTMNALYLKDLAQKTRRGIEGRVRAGRSGGGLCYGYTVVDERDARGDLVRGGRCIVPAEAAIVQRIFAEYVAGASPRTIAQRLNREGIPGPAGAAWGPSTLYGNWRRGTGILNNELYIGRVVWNRQRYVKNPATGKRVSQPNPPEAWVTLEQPDLRIVEQDVWDSTKARQLEARSVMDNPGGHMRPVMTRRPAYLLSGLMTCGVCGGGYSKINRDHYGCSRTRNTGTCSNTLTIRRDVIEARVLEGLKRQLMQPEAVRDFVAHFNAELNRLWNERNGQRVDQEAELKRVQRDLDKVIDAIVDGLRTQEIRDRLAALETRKADLKAALAVPAEPMPALHPGIADVYARKVGNLAAALDLPEERAEASQTMRALIEQIRLVPEDGSLAVELYGELGAILRLCGSGSRNASRPRGATEGAFEDVSLKLVAGAQCHLYRTGFRL